MDDAVRSPAVLLGKRFRGMEIESSEDVGGIWELDSFSQSRSGIEYHVQFEDIRGLIPMDAGEMHSLLSQSSQLVD